MPNALPPEHTELEHKHTRTHAHLHTPSQARIADVKWLMASVYRATEPDQAGEGDAVAMVVINDILQVPFIQCNMARYSICFDYHTVSHYDINDTESMIVKNTRSAEI
jgi:hypothetical protein